MRCILCGCEVVLSSASWLARFRSSFWVFGQLTRQRRRRRKEAGGTTGLQLAVHQKLLGSFVWQANRTYRRRPIRAMGCSGRTWNGGATSTPSRPTQRQPIKNAPRNRRQSNVTWKSVGKLRACRLQTRRCRAPGSLQKCIAINPSETRSILNFRNSPSRIATIRANRFAGWHD
jgi:hypothetical protein